MLGVNISGAEYSAPGGTLGYDYTYPFHSEIDYYASHGLNVIRMPISLERLQPTPYRPLDSQQTAQMDDVISYAAQRGVTVDIDPHNYGYAYGNMIGGTTDSTNQFADFWSKMASHFDSHPNVMFGLMNEPHDQTPQQWAGAAQAAVNAIRATGASQEILTPGTDWTGAQPGSTPATPRSSPPTSTIPATTWRSKCICISTTTTRALAPRSILQPLARIGWPRSPNGRRVPATACSSANSAPHRIRQA